MRAVGERGRRGRAISTPAPFPQINHPKRRIQSSPEANTAQSLSLSLLRTATKSKQRNGDGPFSNTANFDGDQKGVLNKIKYLLSSYLPFIQFPHGTAGRELLDAVLDDILWTIYRERECASELLESIHLDCRLSIVNRDVTAALSHRFHSAMPTKFSVAVSCDILVRLAKQQELLGNNMLKLIEPNILAAIYKGLPSERNGLPAARGSTRSKVDLLGRETNLQDVYTAKPYFELDTQSRTCQRKQEDQMEALKRSNKVCACA
jgi:hypothetical protein